MRKLSESKRVCTCVQTEGGGVPASIAEPPFLHVLFVKIELVDCISKCTRHICTCAQACTHTHATRQPGSKVNSLTHSLTHSQTRKKKKKKKKDKLAPLPKAQSKDRCTCQNYIYIYINIYRVGRSVVRLWLVRVRLGPGLLNIWEVDR